MSQNARHVDHEAYARRFPGHAASVAQNVDDGGHFPGRGQGEHQVLFRIAQAEQPQNAAFRRAAPEQHRAAARARLFGRLHHPIALIPAHNAHQELAGRVDRRQQAHDRPSPAAREAGSRKASRRRAAAFSRRSTRMPKT